MGSSRATADEVPSLARGFYELILLCPDSKLSIEDVRFALGPGGMVVSSGGGEDADLTEFVPISLPEGFEGFRLR